MFKKIFIFEPMSDEKVVDYFLFQNYCFVQTKLCFKKICFFDLAITPKRKMKSTIGKTKNIGNTTPDFIVYLN